MLDKNQKDTVFIARTDYSHAIAAEHRALLLQKSFYHLKDEFAMTLCNQLIDIARQHADDERQLAEQAINTNPAKG